MKDLGRVLLGGGAGKHPQGVSGSVRSFGAAGTRGEDVVGDKGRATAQRKATQTRGAKGAEC